MRTAIAAAISCVLVGSLSAAEYAAAAIRQDTHIPAQRLDAALEVFARDRALQLVYAADEVANLHTAGASGNLSATEALGLLLRGTGLTHQFVDEKTVTVHLNSKSTGETRPQAEAGADSQARAQASSIWSRLRLAQVDQWVTPSSSSLEGSPQDSSKSVEQQTIDEVVVTAQKRQERLIDVPQSVTAIATDELVKSGIVQFRDFANTVPGLSFATLGAGYNQVTLRGVTTGQDASPTVAIYVDEVPYGSSTAFNGHAQRGLDVGLFDLERIEVLRGPQGTLYGASTLGGLLKYVTKQPDANRFGVGVQTGVSATHDGGVSFHGAGTVNTPIVTDKAVLRVTGFYSRDGGYIDDLTHIKEDVNRADIYGGRADLLLTPTDALDIRLTGYAQDIARDGMGVADYSFAGVPIDGELDQRRRVPEPFEQHFRLVSGTVTYELNWVSLISISSYQTTWTREIWDFSGLYVPLFASSGILFSSVAGSIEAPTDKFTQEIRLTSTAGETIEWLIGGFYTHESSDNELGLIAHDLASNVSPIDLLTFSSPSRYEEYAAFGELTWHLTDRIDVAGGIRYAENRQKYEQTASGLFGLSAPATRASDDVSTYMANARYHFSDHSTAYLRYATGYRPGGPNFVTVSAVTGQVIGDPTFNADRLKSYEVGFKAETEDRRFGIDVAAYYIDWTDIQIITTSGGFAAVANAPGGAEVKGAELALSAHPIPAFTMFGAFAYQEAKMSKDEPLLGAAKDERLPNVPRFTAALNADYELPMGRLQPTIGATLRHVDDRTASFNDAPGHKQYHLPDYTSVDLRLGFTFGSVDTQLYVRNVFDEQGQLSAQTSRGLAMPAIVQPRTIGITATTHF